MMLPNTIGANIVRLGLSRLTLAKRYLWGALIAALFPLVIMAILYDQYSATLLNNIINNKVESQLEAAAVKMNNFVSVQVNRLENIVDLPDTTSFFSDVSSQMPERMSDFLLLETESPDIYAIEFSDLRGNILTTIPSSKTRKKTLDLSVLPIIQYNNVEILGPVLPRNGRPGWFLIRMPAYLNQERIGIVSLRMRLASLTELSASLMQPTVYEPQIVIFNRVRVSSVGTQDKVGKILAQSRQIMPGWRINLIEKGGKLTEPRVQIRYILIVVALFSAIGLVWLFVQMSERLTKFLEPFTVGARAISNGNFSLRVSENGPGELGSLGRSFNKMSSQIDTMINSRIDVERRATLGNMAAGIAHEIRNPLATVTTTLHGLNRNEKDVERQQMYELICDEIRRVDNTISEFLKYAKPRDPVKETVLIRDVFKSVKTLTAASMYEKNIALNLLGDSTIELEIDHAHLKQILLNLTLNAIKALPTGGHIILKAHRDGKTAEISVTDDGIGMDKDTAVKIFRPFFTTRVGGTGLGLSVTKQLVEDNDGTLNVESAPNHGTRITLIFPTNTMSQL